MPEALPLVAQPDLPSQVNAVERDGYVYLPVVLDGDQVAELRGHMERLEPLAGSYDRASDLEDGFLNRSINNAFNRDPHFVQFLDYPSVIEIAEAVLGADCHVIAMTSWLTGPGRPDQATAASSAWRPTGARKAPPASNPPERLSPAYVSSCSPSAPTPSDVRQIDHALPDTAANASGPDCQVRLSCPKESAPVRTHTTSGDARRRGDQSAPRKQPSRGSDRGYLRLRVARARRSSRRVRPRPSRRRG